MPGGDFFRDHSNEINTLLTKFQSFPDISKTKIELWIENFSDQDRELALKVLDKVDYFSTARIFTACRDIFTQLKTLKNNDLSKVYFCNFGNPANSGQHLSSMFAAANGLTGSNSWRFKQVSELNDLSLERGITLVFLDDFVGTGNQVLDYWGGIASIVPQDADVYLGIVCAFEEGIQNIQENTEMKVLCHERLNDSNKLFSPSNPNFTQSEKDILINYCNSTGSRIPQGYGNCQAIVVLSYRTPNNTVSILSVQNENWNGIFPRHHNYS